MSPRFLARKCPTNKGVQQYLVGAGTGVTTGSWSTPKVGRCQPIPAKKAMGLVMKSTIEQYMCFGLQSCLKPNETKQSKQLPSGKRLHSYGKSPSLIGKSTLNGPCSIAMLNSQRVY